MAPEKGCHLAIGAAKKAAIKLIIAAKCSEPNELAYFHNSIRPQLGQDVIWLGEVSTRVKKILLSRAQCLLFPIQHEEPFGLVMVEAQACGTPVVALRAGSVSEVVLDETTGYIVDTPHELPEAIHAAAALCPHDCRSWVAETFNVSRMIDSYEDLYFSVL
jgi:glycosyltransferase involved in cell wall biosynthesis